MASVTHSSSRSHKKAKRRRDKSGDEALSTANKRVKIEPGFDVKAVPILESVSSPALASTSATLGWEMDDLNTLVNNLAKCLPKNDVAKFSTLVEKLDWEKVRFGLYSAQQCKDKWFQVMSRLRRYRTLTDMVADSRLWLKAPWQTYNNAKKIKHPDLPKKPLTPFFRYFMEKREKMGKSNPGSSVTDLAKMLSSKFASLSEKKKQKYKDAYDREYEEYKSKLEQFKVDHPEVEFGSMNKQQSSHGLGQGGPQRPRTPQQLFMEEKLKKGANNNEAKKEAIERIKKMWHDLSEGKRIKWIRRSLLDEQRFDAEVIEYMKEHPSFEQTKSKPVLTKAEKELKDKFDGKPERPPNSGYSLFSKILLRELTDIPSKEKMVVIAKRWKELPDNTRAVYNKDAQKAMSRYVEKFEQYLSCLSEGERAKVLSENKFKLPSEKKLKQSQNLPKQELKAPEPMVEPRDKEHAALMCYQMERLSVVQEKYPNRGKQDVMKIIIQEWSEKLSDKKKAKYYKMAESFAAILPTVSKTIGNDNTLTSSKSINAKEKKTMSTVFKKQPKRPPKSGYALFTSEQLSRLTDFEPKKRMTEIARRWNSEISKSEKENYDTRAKEMALVYERSLDQFKNTLTQAELQQYLSLNEKTKPKGKGKAKSSKAAADPVVDDSNVIETIDVSTTGDRVNNSSDESESESENEEQNEEQKESSENEGSESESEEEGGEEEENEEEEDGGDDGEEGDEDAEGSESDSNSSDE